MYFTNELVHHVYMLSEFWPCISQYAFNCSSLFTHTHTKTVNNCSSFLIGSVESSSQTLSSKRTLENLKSYSKSCANLKPISRQIAVKIYTSSNYGNQAPASQPKWWDLLVRNSANKQEIRCHVEAYQVKSRLNTTNSAKPNKLPKLY